MSDTTLDISSEDMETCWAVVETIEADSITLCVISDALLIRLRILFIIILILLLSIPSSSLRFTLGVTVKSPLAAASVEAITLLIGIPNLIAKNTPSKRANITAIRDRYMVSEPISPIGAINCSLGTRPTRVKPVGYRLPCLSVLFIFE